MDRDYQGYALTARDVLFFRDARPADMDKALKTYREIIGHGANWPRPDHLFAALLHHLIRDPDGGERDAYGSMPELQTVGPFPETADGTLMLPMPLDWDMALSPVPAGRTDLPAPLTHGFCDRQPGKKRYPAWISVGDYARYLSGEVGRGDGADEPDAVTLWAREHRTGITLDDTTGASLRRTGRASGRYRAEYLRLAPGVRMRCALRGAPTLGTGDALRMGGQGGTVSVAPAVDPVAELKALPRGTPTRFVRWTLIAPALFPQGWLPGWLDGEGRVKFPSRCPTRRPGETRAAYRARFAEEAAYFRTARLIAARVGTAQPISGWDSRDGARPTELAVPAGSCYVFECADAEEASVLAEALNLVPRSDLGEKGLGLGLSSYVTPSEI